MPSLQHTSLKQQQGSVLLIGMIFLVVLMIGATSIMNSAVQDERISGNTKANTEAFFAAEAGYSSLVDHLLATDQGKDASVAKSRWDAIDAEINTYANAAAWSAANIDNKVDGFNQQTFNSAAGSKFTVEFAPVFDSSGNRVNNKILFVSEGQSGRSSRSIGFELEGGGGGGGPNAPAAISCFGAACKITSGAGNDSVISGRNHPVPASDCSGNSCWNSPYTAGDGEDLVFSVPAAYITDYDGSQLGSQGGKGKNKDLSFIGQDKSYADYENANDYYTSGTDKDAGSVWTPSDFPNDENNQSTAPTTEDYFGENDSVISELLTKAGSEIGDVGSNTVALVDTATTSQLNKKPSGGVLIIDGNGGEFKAAGTGFFAGLVIIRGCNQWSSRGNFTIYGAVIVDATGCGDDYFPFDSRGTPDLKYSSEALENAGIGSGSGGGFNGVTSDWYEITGN